MRKLGISIDGVIRDFNTQFHKTYVRTFIHNESLVGASIPTHTEARMHGLTDTDFVAHEQTEEEERLQQEDVARRERELISLPVTSEDLLNHYKFEEQKMDFIPSVDGSNDDIILSPKQVLQKFIYDDYPFQIFGQAPEYENAMEWFNRIQGYGKQKGLFETVLLSTTQRQAIPATFSFLGKYHSRSKSVVFVDREEDKWDHCDVLIDAHPRALQSVTQDKFVIRIARDWNQYDNIEYTWDSLKAVHNSGILDKLFK